MTKIGVRSAILFIALLSYVNASAATFYSSAPDIPFPWDKPEAFVNLNKLYSIVPLGDFSLTSKFLKDSKWELKNYCEIKFLNDNGVIRLEYSGTGYTFSNGAFVPSQATGSISIPREHFVQPLRERLFTQFGFPEVTFVTGKIEVNPTMKELSLTIYSGMNIFKTGNNHWISNIVSKERLTLSFDTSGNKLLSFSTRSAEKVSMRCEAAQGIPLSRPFDAENLFLSDFPSE